MGREFIATRGRSSAASVPDGKSKVCKLELSRMAEGYSRSAQWEALYKKTISAAQFVACLEQAFKQRISRQQQDAQEFLQVVAERLCDEYHAGHRARAYARNLPDQGDLKVTLDEESVDQKLNQLSLENDITPQDAYNLRAGAATSSIPLTPPRWKAQNEFRQNSWCWRGRWFPWKEIGITIECLTLVSSQKPANNVLFFDFERPSNQLYESQFLFRPNVQDGIYRGFQMWKCRLIHALDTLSKNLQSQTQKNLK